VTAGRRTGFQPSPSPVRRPDALPGDLELTAVLLRAFVERIAVEGKQIERGVAGDGFVSVIEGEIEIEPADAARLLACLGRGEVERGGLD
jgi:hypothetical protein